MPAPRIVIVEDDAELQRVLVRGLGEEGFETAAVGTGAALLERAGDWAADALVIDVGLPDADGRDLCQALRAQGIQTPVLFLTAHDAVPDRVAGFNAGGDDYLTKPFDFDELVARLRSLLRRGGNDTAVEVGPLRLDPVAHAASCGGKSTTLTPTEFRLLGALAGRSGEAVRRRELLGAGWPPGAIVHDNTLDVYIARLRRKLRALPGAPDITTVHGVGYRIG
ncbi:MAG TPA: response regulator transcription factor [Solirubrobacteraceae bacterium]|nr:response regulator transcription factor [Solirubrobacteraceae bacterium]